MNIITAAKIELTEINGEYYIPRFCFFNSYGIPRNSFIPALTSVYCDPTFKLSKSLIIKPCFMQRYNIFNQIHKGLRALLYETALQVQHTDFWNIDEADEAIAKIEDVIRLFEKHAYSEDTYVFPVLEKYEPSLADTFEQEHVKDHALAKLLEKTLTAYKRAEIITDKVPAAKEIQAAYNEFMVFNLEHMAKEERVLNPILWRYYTDHELMAVTQQIVANVPQEYMAKYSKWMMRGLNNAEIAGWLRGVEKNAPEVVFQSLFVTAEQELPERRFRLVLESLTEGAMLA
jgi:iron-sulfur cluster repair protein YtfE (RIC family)